MTDPFPPDDLERPLAALRPAPPSPALMARLRSARPSIQRSPVAAGFSRTTLRSMAAAAAVVVASLVWLAVAPKPTAPRLTSDHPAASPPALTVIHQPRRAAVTPPIFLPVESNRRLVSLQPVHAVQRPDEPPRRLLRAVIVDDMTAVGADTDAALHVRSAREVYLPMTSTIY
jgi:hypothetical protein